MSTFQQSDMRSRRRLGEENGSVGGGWPQQQQAQQGFYQEQQQQQQQQQPWQQQQQSYHQPQDWQQQQQQYQQQTPQPMMHQSPGWGSPSGSGQNGWPQQSQPHQQFSAWDTQPTSSWGNGHSASPSGGWDRSESKDEGKQGGLASMSSELRVALGLLLLTSILLHADQNLASPNLSAIASDFEMTPLQKDTRLGGLVQFGFFVIGGACSMFVGPMADTMDRVTLLSGVVVAGSLPCLLTLWIPSSKAGFFYFFLARVVTGIAIGGSFPVLYSLTSDLFPASQRNFVSACVGASCNIGAAVGGVMAGLVGPTMGWRMPFVFVALPALVCAAVLRVAIRDPRAKAQAERGRSAAANSAFSAWTGGQQQKQVGAGCVSMEDLDFGKFKKVGQVKSNMYIFVQSLPGCIPISVIVTFLSDYLSVEQGMGVKASTGITAFFGLSCLAFNFLGGTAGQVLYNTQKEMLCFAMAGMTAFAAIPFILLVNSPQSAITSPEGTPTAFAYLLAVLGGTTAFAGPNIRAVLMNVNSSNDRGTVFSAFTLFDDLGKGGGPMLIVALIAIFGRRLAFTVAFCLWCVSGGVLFMLSRTLPKDAARGDSGSAFGMDKCA